MKSSRDVQKTEIRAAMLEVGRLLRQTSIGKTLVARVEETSTASGRGWRMGNQGIGVCRPRNNEQLHGQAVLSSRRCQGWEDGGGEDSSSPEKRPKQDTSRVGRSGWRRLGSCCAVDEMISAEEISKNLPPPGKQQTAQSYCITARLPVGGCRRGHWLRRKAVSHHPGSINNVRVSTRQNYNQYLLNNNCGQPWLGFRLYSASTFSYQGP